MRHRWLWSVVILCLLLWGIKAVHHAMQPQYQGKTAEEWFDAIQIRKPGQGRNEHTYTMLDPAVTALAKMDADAVRVIVEKYQQEDSALRRWLIHQVEHYSKGKKLWESQEDRRIRAYLVVFELKDKADPLVPLLVHATETDDGMERQRAIVNLGRVTTRPAEALPVLISMLGTSNMFHRAFALESISAYRNHAEIAVNLLTKSLNSTNRLQRILSARSLVDFGQTNRAYAVLLHEVTDTNSPARVDAALMFSLFGTNAAPAIPVIQELMVNATDAETSNSLRLEIKEIDPEGLYHKP